MKSRPILFSAPMVRALLAGTKTQTRRIVKPQPPLGCSYAINGAESHACCFATDNSSVWVPPTPTSNDHRIACPHGAPGDRLWVKETWWTDSHWHGVKPTKLPQPGPDKPGAQIHYAATSEVVPDGFLRPSLFMRRWMSRITLELTAVRVERLQDISEADAVAEGVDSTMPFLWRADEWQNKTPNVARYAGLWELINGPGSWAENPWVWCVSFRRVEGGAS